MLAIRANYPVTTTAGRTVKAAQAARLILQRAWQRLRTGDGGKGGRSIWRRRHQHRAWQAHLRWHAYASSTM